KESLVSPCVASHRGGGKSADRHDPSSLAALVRDAPTCLCRGGVLRDGTARDGCMVGCLRCDRLAGRPEKWWGMTTSVLLDTSFLISLVDGSRLHHRVAVKYYQFLLGRQIPMYFSAIVAAEFGVKQ